MKFKRILFVLVCAVLALTATGTNAMADIDAPTETPAVAEGSEDPLEYIGQNARDVDWNDNQYKECSPTGLGAKGCVQPYGDVLWLLDREANGWGVRLRWRELRPLGGGFYRLENWGRCTNDLGSAVGWTICDADFGEGYRIDWWLEYWDNGWKKDPPGNNFVYVTTA